VSRLYKELRAVAAVARADFVERMRRRSFFVVTALTLWACFAAVPPPESNFSLLAIGGARGTYTSSWFGLMFGLVVVFVMPLAGFYLVRGAINRDRETRVGPILAASPLSRAGYVVGKAASNFALLATILIAVSLGAAGMFLLRREVPGIDLIQLWRPLWAMSLPVLATVAALAVAFESLSGLRGGAGNVVYFFLWAVGLGLLIQATTGPGEQVRPQNDFLGVSRPIAEAQSRLPAEAPGSQGGFRVGIGRTSDEKLRVVPWPPAQHGPRRLAERATWLWPSAILLLGAVAAFDRFDPSREGERRRRRGRPSPSAETDATEIAVSASAVPRSTAAALTLPSIAPPSGRAGPRILFALAIAELHLMLRPQPWWWWTGLAALIVTSVAMPLTSARTNLNPFLWIWPVLCWSALGAREHRDGIAPLMASAPAAAWRPAIAGWMAGLLLALVLVAGLAARHLAAGDGGAAGAALAGAAFVPALAVACGTLTRGSRTFEAVFLLWWYLASNGAVSLDFMGRSPEAVEAGLPFVYFGLTVGLLGATIAARRWSRS
jgi:hypothetical protein